MKFSWPFAMGAGGLSSRRMGIIRCLRSTSSSFPVWISHGSRALMRTLLSNSPEGQVGVWNKVEASPLGLAPRNEEGRRMVVVQMGLMLSSGRHV